MTMIRFMVFESSFVFDDSKVPASALLAYDSDHKNRMIFINFFARPRPSNPHFAIDDLEPSGSFHFFNIPNHRLNSQARHIC